jgi:carbonic anhydrase/acetyltransferase-like protein (isoleucine patch superfamily)
MTIYQYKDKVPQIHESAFVAKEAIIIGDVILGEDVSVMPGVVIRGDNEPITLGKGSNVQEGTVMHTDMGCPLTVADNVTIGHQAMLHGCTIGEGSLIGIQAIILNRAVIGKNCLVGAGSVVTEGKVFPDNSLILGSPAKVVRELTPEALEGMKANSASYVAKKDLFKQHLVEIPQKN